MFEFGSPLWAVIAFVLAYYSCFFLTSFSARNMNEDNRLKSIDGLRGYLALAVFIHHASIWFFYIKNGAWRPPASSFYNQLGQVGVIIFFMITGFLFVLKLLNSNVINWLDFYRARVLRLFPVYVFSISLMVLIVSIETDLILIDPRFMLVENLLKWYFFTIYGNPDLNGVVGTRYIVAGVPWSLPFEWMFYFCLPIINSLIVGKVSKWGVFFSLIGVYLVAKINPEAFYWVAFICGALAACIYKMHINLKSNFLAYSSVALMGCVLIFFDGSYNTKAILFMAPFFTMVAAGGVLSNIFTKAPSVLLGEISYDLYLLHGIVLYVVLKYIVGFDRIKLMTEIQYWVLILFIMPFLLLACIYVNRWIERPFLGGR